MRPPVTSADPRVEAVMELVRTAIEDTREEGWADLSKIRAAVEDLARGAPEVSQDTLPVVHGAPKARV